MTQRRRRYRDDEDDVPHPTASFTWGNILNLGGIPLLTAIAVFVGQWALTGDTVKRHGESIKEIVTSREEERKQREGMRVEFQASQKQLVDVLSKLETRLAVSEKQQETAGRQIEKIGDFLQRNTSQKVPVR